MPIVAEGCHGGRYPDAGGKLSDPVAGVMVGSWVARDRPSRRSSEAYHHAELSSPVPSVFRLDPMTSVGHVHQILDWARVAGEV